MTDKDKEDAKALLIAAGLDSEVAAVLARCSTLECVKSEIAKICQKHITRFTQEHATSNPLQSKGLK